MSALVEDAMGNSQAKKRDPQFSRNVVEGRIPSTLSRTLSPPPEPPQYPPELPQYPPEPVSYEMHHGTGKLSTSTKEKYALIPDKFTSLEQVSYSCFPD